jgi:hypothetical protein
MPAGKQGATGAAGKQESLPRAKSFKVLAIKEIPPVADEVVSTQVYKEIMEAVRKKKGGRVTDFVQHCRQYGQSVPDDVQKNAGILYEYLKSTAGNSEEAKALVMKMILIIPEWEKRCTLLFEAGLLDKIPTAPPADENVVGKKVAAAAVLLFCPGALPALVTLQTYKFMKARSKGAGGGNDDGAEVLWGDQGELDQKVAQVTSSKWVQQNKLRKKRISDITNGGASPRGKDGPEYLEHGLKRLHDFRRMLQMKVWKINTAEAAILEACISYVKQQFFRDPSQIVLKAWLADVKLSSDWSAQQKSVVILTPTCFYTLNHTEETHAEAPAAESPRSYEGEGGGAGPEERAGGARSPLQDKQDSLRRAASKVRVTNCVCTPIDDVASVATFLSSPGCAQIDLSPERLGSGVGEKLGRTLAGALLGQKAGSWAGARHSQVAPSAPRNTGWEAVLAGEIVQSVQSVHSIWKRPGRWYKLMRHLHPGVQVPSTTADSRVQCAEWRDEMRPGKAMRCDAVR